MAAANVELAAISYKGAPGFSLHGPCIRSESLAVSGSTATLTTAVDGLEGIEVFRLISDTAIYFARGTAPDPTLTAKSQVSSARRYLPAGVVFDGQIMAGEKVAVRAA